MTGRWNGFLMNWMQMALWWTEWLNKRLVDEMAVWWNGSLIKCQADETALVHFIKSVFHYHIKSINMPANILTTYYSPSLAPNLSHLTKLAPIKFWYVDETERRWNDLTPTNKPKTINLQEVSTCLLLINFCFNIFCWRKNNILTNLILKGDKC